MMRSTDSQFLNRVVNDPSVKPWVSLGVSGYLDMTPAVSNPENIFLADEYGGTLFVKTGNGIYDLHTQFLPEGRGKHVREFAVEALRYMFVDTDCIAITTFIQDENLSAQRMALWCGFKPMQVAELLGKDGMIYSLTIKQWVQEGKCQQ